MKKISIFRLFNADTLLFSVSVCLLMICGCKKDVVPADNSLSTSTSDKVVQDNSIPKGYIMTPVGLMKSENVHRLEPGYAILMEHKHAYKVLASSGAKVEDWGAIADSDLVLNLKQRIRSLADNNANTNGSTTPPSGLLDGNNWVTYAQYSNSTTPIMSFSTSWTVPANPLNNTGQLFYIWNGISASPSSLPLIQPVLQWGNNGGWGGQNWSLNNWCVFSNTQAAVMPPRLNLAPGTNLQGVITCTGQQANGSKNYTCAFTGFPNQTLSIIQGNTYTNFPTGTGIYPSIGTFKNAYEVLEVPNQITNVNQYPNQGFVAMNNIQIYTGNNSPVSYPSINWTVTTTGATLGEHTQTFPNIQGNNGGLVDLWFRPGTQFLNAAVTKNFYRNNCGTGSSGTQVPYSVPYGRYTSTTSQADADQQAQNDINANGQNYANANGSCNTGTPIPVSVSNPNSSAGYIPSVNFIDPTTNAIVVSKSFYSSGGTIYVPGGTYKVTITQTNNKPFTASITGYGSQSGSTVNFINVVIPSSGTFSGSISINNN